MGVGVGGGVGVLGWGGGLGGVGGGVGGDVRGGVGGGVGVGVGRGVEGSAGVAERCDGLRGDARLPRREVTLERPE